MFTFANLQCGSGTRRDCMKTRKQCLARHIDDPPELYNRTYGKMNYVPHTSPRKKYAMRSGTKNGKCRRPQDDLREKHKTFNPNKDDIKHPQLLR